MKFFLFIVIYFFSESLFSLTSTEKLCLDFIKKEDLGQNSFDMLQEKCALKGIKNLNYYDSDFETPLHYAVLKNHLKAVRFLVDQGALINIPDQRFLTPLHYAAANDQVEIIRYLVKKGAQIDFQGYFGDTPLLVASSHGALNAVKELLLEGANINKKNDLFENAYQLAAENGFYDVLQCLKDHNINTNSYSYFNGQDALHMALKKKNNIKVIDFLLQNTSVNKVTLYKKQTPLILSVILNRPDNLQFLLSKGALVNKQDGQGKTPLYWAVFTNNLPIVKILLKAGANINIKDEKNVSPKQLITILRRKVLKKFINENLLNVDKKLTNNLDEKKGANE